MVCALGRLNFELKYPLLNWTRIALHKDAPALKGIYKYLQAHGELGKGLWRRLTSIWPLVCAAARIITYRFAAALILLFTARIVDLFRLFRETDWAENLGDSFVLPSMCGTGGAQGLSNYSNATGYEGRDDYLFELDREVAAIIWVFWVGALAWPVLFLIIPMLFGGRGDARWELEKILAPMTSGMGKDQTTLRAFYFEKEDLETHLQAQGCCMAGCCFKSCWWSCVRGSCTFRGLKVGNETETLPLYTYHLLAPPHTWMFFFSERARRTGPGSASVKQQQLKHRCCLHLDG